MASFCIRRLTFVLALLALLGFARSQDSKENAEFKLAVSLYNDKLYDLAAEQLKRFIETYPNTHQAIQARFYLGLAQMELRQYEAARLTFQNFALSYPENPQAADAWWKVAEAYLALKNLPEAASAFERLKVFYPKSPRAPEALLKSAEYFRLAGVPDRSKKVLRTLIQEYPTSAVLPEARLQLAETYAAEGNYEQARLELKRLLQKTKDRNLKARALLLTGQTFEQQEKLEEAEKAYRELIDSFQNTDGFTEATYRLGLLQQKTGRAFESIATFKNVLADPSPRHSLLRQKALLGIGKSYFGLKDFSNSTLYLDQLLRQTPTAEIALEAHRLAGAASEELKQYRRALEHYRAIMADTGAGVDKRVGYIGAGRASRQLRDFQGAIAYFQNFLDVYPDDLNAPTILLTVGEIYEKEIGGDEGERNGLATYQKLLSRYPKSHLVDDALFRIARLQESMKEYDRSIRSYTELTKRYPASPHVGHARERIRWITTFEPTPTATSLNKLAQLLAKLIAGGSKGESAFYLGQIYFNDLKDFGSATTMFSAAIENNVPEPNLSEAYYYRARSLQLLAEKNRTSMDSAVYAYEQFLQRYPVHPHSAAAAAQIAILKITGTQPVDGPKIAEEFVLRYPGSAEGAMLLLEAGKVLLTQKKTEKAALAFQQVISWFSSSPHGEEAQFRLGLALESLGKKDSAQKVFEAYLHQYPDGTWTVDILARRARASMESGKLSEAVSNLRTIIEKYYYSPEAEKAELYLAEVYASSRQYDSAIALCRRIVKEKEETLFERKISLRPLYLLATVYQLKGEKAKAKKYYLAYLREERRSEDAINALVNLSQLYREEGNLELSQSYLQQAVDAGGGRELKKKLAEMLFETGEYARAESLLSELGSSATSPEERIHFEHRMIISWIRQGKLADADARTKQFERSYKGVEEQLAEIEYERGTYYYRKKEYTPALNSFQKLIKEYRKSKLVPAAHYWIGKTYEATGQNQKALEKYAEILRGYPRAEILPRVYLALGNIHYRTEKFDSAVAYYRKIVESDSPPKDLLPFAMNNLIEAYKTVGLYEAALHLTRKFVEMYPEDESVQDKKIDIGVLYQRLGYHDQSILHFEHLLEVADSELEGEIRYYIGEGYFGKGDYDHAILEFLKVPYLVTRKGLVDWTANAFYMAAQSYEKMGKYDEAIGMYKQIVDRPGIDQTFKAAAMKEIDRVNAILKRPAKKSGE